MNFSNTSSAFRELVEAMVHPDPYKRLCNFTQIKRHNWLRNIRWDRIKHRQEPMPIKLQLYTNYIHDEFKKKDFDWDALKEEGRYDKLFDMFNYMREHDDGICHYYSQRKGSKKAKEEHSWQSSGHSKKGKTGRQSN
jgi:hypothetical protein